MQVNVIHEHTQADWKECGVDKILWHEWFYWSASHWVTVFYFAMSSLVFQYEFGLDIFQFILCEETVDQRVDWHAKVKSELPIEIMKFEAQFIHTQSHCYYPSVLESFLLRMGAEAIDSLSSQYFLHLNFSVHRNCNPSSYIPGPDGFLLLLQLLFPPAPCKSNPLPEII